MMATYQHSLWSLLEQWESQLREIARMTKEPRPKGPRTKNGELRQRGRTLGFCAHLDCGGERSVWPYKHVKVCQRHWRQRRRLAELWKAAEERR